MGTKNSKKKSNLVTIPNLNSKNQAQLLKLFIERINEKVPELLEDFIINIQKSPPKEIFVPADIFIKKLTPLEALTKFLKENQNFTLHQIGQILSRDERNIWHTYASAKKKLFKKFKTQSNTLIPVSIFANRKISVTESLVTYLKEDLNLTYHKIALLIHRNDRTVWTVYSRARRKLEKNK